MPTDPPIAFFSYCRADSDFALKLAEDLKAAGARVWMDQLDIEPGTPWDRAVEEALAGAPCMLVILSPVSVSSDNVRDEVSFALSKQKKIIPVLYRDCEVPFRLARLQHIDFRTDYARALNALARTLATDHLSPRVSIHKANTTSSRQPSPEEIAPNPIQQALGEVHEPQRTSSLPLVLQQKPTAIAEKPVTPRESPTGPIARQQIDARSARRRAWFKKYWKWLLPFPAAGIVLMIVFNALGNSSVARSALARAGENPAVIQRLGQPIARGWFPGGSIDETGPSGTADLAIRISGPKGKGTLYVVAKKAAGEWKFETLQVQIDGESSRIDLLNSKMQDLLLKAQAGDANAMARLGYAYRGGEGVPVDYAQAASWFQKAAQAGNPGAMTALGELYFDGNGVPKDSREAFNWFSKAAAMNDPTGLYYLAAMYEKGNGVGKDHTKAIALYRKSAQLGYAPAKQKLQGLGINSP